jgi:hypothetical protein
MECDGMGASPLRLDRLIRARAIYSMTGEVYRAAGLRGAEEGLVVELTAAPRNTRHLAGIPRRWPRRRCRPLVYVTYAIQHLDELDLPGRYRPHLWRM